MAILNWTGYRATDVKTIISNCADGFVYRGWVQEVGGVLYSQRPCPNCGRDDNIKEVLPKDQYNTKLAEYQAAHP